jgi:hypothetical protein
VASWRRPASCVSSGSPGWRQIPSPGAAKTALADLCRLSFVTRHHCHKRITTLLGFKVVQETNAYEVHEPTTALGQLAVKVFRRVFW